MQQQQRSERQKKVKPCKFWHVSLALKSNFKAFLSECDDDYTHSCISSDLSLSVKNSVKRKSEHDGSVDDRKEL